MDAQGRPPRNSVSSRYPRQLDSIQASLDARGSLQVFFRLLTLASTRLRRASMIDIMDSSIASTTDCSPASTSRPRLYEQCAALLR